MATGRTEVLAELSGRILELRRGHPIRVGIDGVDASGKTTLAEALADHLETGGRHVIRASIDDFHSPTAIRYRQGRRSPRGYYEDTFNHEAILSDLLKPLGADGNLRYRHACFDLKADAPMDEPAREATPNSILVFEGVFLHRPELCSFWDFTVFLDVAFDVTIRRAEARDAQHLGGVDKTRELYRQRYIPGQKIYLETVRPAEHADVVIDNSDFDSPVLGAIRQEELATVLVQGPNVDAALYKSTQD